MSSIAEECVAHSDSGDGGAKVTAGTGVAYSVTGAGAARVAAALTPCAEPVLHIRDADNFRKAVQRVFSSALISSSPVTPAPWCPKWQRPLRCQEHCAPCQHRGTCRVRPEGLRTTPRTGTSWAFRHFGKVTFGPTADSSSL